MLHGRSLTPPVLAELDELSVGALAMLVVDRGRQHDGVGGDRPHREVAAGGPILRHERLDDEAPRPPQPRCHVVEQRLLACRRLEVEQRVVGDEHGVERPGRQVVHHVTVDGLDRSLRVGVGQRSQHRRARVEPGDLEAGRGRRDRQPAGPDTELQQAGSISAVGHRDEVGEQLDHIGGVAQPGVPLVVDVGERLSVAVGAVALHVPILPVPQPWIAWSVVDPADTLCYLDHAATTPMRQAAVEAMLPYLSDRFANPSGAHRFARQARKAVEDARDAVAAAVGAQPGEVVFTGGGTESDNAALLGTPDAAAGRTRLVCAASEHHAVLHVVEAAGGTVVPTDAAARVELDALADVLGPDVATVSVMAVNNEVGVVTDVAAVAELVRSQAADACLHTDAVQAASWLDLRDVWAHVDLMSLSAHKFGGPKGVGVLVVRRGTRLAPLIVGGGQERELRSGTHNVAGIVAMAVALSETDTERADVCARVTSLRDHLVDGLTSELDGVVETVGRADKVAGSAHVCFADVESESLLYLLDQGGVCASAASACASGAMAASHVLAAMGVGAEWSRGALRMSLGRTTTRADVDRAIAVLVDAVSTLRARRASRRAVVSRP